MNEMIWMQSSNGLPLVFFVKEANCEVLLSRRFNVEEDFFFFPMDFEDCSELEGIKLGGTFCSEDTFAVSSEEDFSEEDDFFPNMSALKSFKFKVFLSLDFFFRSIKKTIIIA